jgi:hypothetical protein
MMNWKGCGRKLLWLNFRYYLGIRLEEVRETTKSQEGRSEGRVDPGPPEYKSGILTTIPRRSVISLLIQYNILIIISKM